MRFFRLYWIPDQFSPAEGAYVSDRAEDLLGILSFVHQPTRDQGEQRCPGRPQVGLRVDVPGVLIVKE